MPKRRANGEGNIRKRKDGRWEGRYTAGYDPENGKRLIKNVLGKTQAEVKEKLKSAISESQKLDVSKVGSYTVASWVRTWYEVYAEPRIRPNTKAYYTNYIENHIVPGIGDVSLDKLTTIQIQRFYNNLQKSGRVQRKNFPELKDKSLSPRVVRGVHTLLHNCLEQAVAERLILSNPAQGCKLPQLEKKEMKILPQEKIGMYLAEAERRDDGNGALKQMMTYVQEHYAEPLRIRDVAAAGFVSERECYRAFHDALHASPLEYVTDVRLRHACARLAKGSESVTGIALACGFGSASFFGKVFRARFGATPTEYRRSWQDSTI